MMFSEEEWERWRVAYHEATHAAVALKFGRTIDELKLCNEGGGYCRYISNAGWWESAMVTLAGRLGEEIFTGETRMVSDECLRSNIHQLRRGENLDHDDVKLLKCALEASPDATDDELIETYRDWESEAHRVVSDPDLRALIEDIAAVLHGHGCLNGEAVRLLVMNDEDLVDEAAMRVIEDEAMLAGD